MQASPCERRRTSYCDCSCVHVGLACRVPFHVTKKRRALEEGVKRNIVALDKFVALFPYTYIGQEPVEEMFLAALTRF